MVSVWCRRRVDFFCMLKNATRFFRFIGWELIHFKLRFNDKCQNFICTYNSPKQSCIEYMSKLDDFVHELDLSLDLFIVGDLNMNWLNEKGRPLREFCDRNNFANYIKLPTRMCSTIKSSTATLIDVVLHNNTSILNHESIAFPFSDHNLIVIDCSFDSMIVSSAFIKTYWLQICQT